MKTIDCEHGIPQKECQIDKLQAELSEAEGRIQRAYEILKYNTRL